MDKGTWALAVRSDDFAVKALGEISPTITNIAHFKQDIEAGEEFTTLIDILEEYPEAVPSGVVDGLASILAEYPANHLYRAVGEKAIVKYHRAKARELVTA